MAIVDGDNVSVSEPTFGLLALLGFAGRALPPGGTIQAWHTLQTKA